jgi:hypothetical protein
MRVHQAPGGNSATTPLTILRGLRGGKRQKQSSSKTRRSNKSDYWQESSLLIRSASGSSGQICIGGQSSGRNGLECFSIGGAEITGTLRDLPRLTSDCTRIASGCRSEQSLESIRKSLQCLTTAPRSRRTLPINSWCMYGLLRTSHGSTGPRLATSMTSAYAVI